MPDGSATAHFYRPKLVSALAEGYHFTTFRKDALAGLTVAIVALPLSMAIAVASGVSPERGLYAAIVGGFLVSALGGSRYQVGGPAGAFIVMVSATVTHHGVDGMLVATLLSGFLLMLLGLSRLGTLIRFIPQAVTVGFTCGIAITILASQLRDLGGLSLTTAEPGHLYPKLLALFQALPTTNWIALGMGIASIAIIVCIRRWRPLWPSMLIAVAVVSLVGVLGRLPVETIGSRFGGLPSGLPHPAFPEVSLARLIELLPTALSFTLLGGVESLLSAKMADGMTGRKHRYNMELLAQGLANVASAVFGGIVVTGTTARTAANIRAGARSPIAGMLHSVFLLLFILLVAPLANFVPLSALAGLLIVVCWHMVEKNEVAHLVRQPETFLILLVTLGLTLAFDLTAGIAGGCLAATATHFLRRQVP